MHPLLRLSWVGESAAAATCAALHPTPAPPLPASAHCPSAVYLSTVIFLFTSVQLCACVDVTWCPQTRAVGPKGSRTGNINNQRQWDRKVGVVRKVDGGRSGALIQGLKSKCGEAGGAMVRRIKQERQDKCVSNWVRGGKGTGSKHEEAMEQSAQVGQSRRRANTVRGIRARAWWQGGARSTAKITIQCMVSSFQSW